MRKWRDLVPDEVCVAFVGKLTNEVIRDAIKLTEEESGSEMLFQLDSVPRSLHKV